MNTSLKESGFTGGLEKGSPFSLVSYGEIVSTHKAKASGGTGILANTMFTLKI